MYQYLCTVQKDCDVYIDGKMQKKGSIFVIESTYHALERRCIFYPEVEKFFAKQGKKIKIGTHGAIDIKAV